MALNARELLLVVRAQNQASGALRRVGRDMQNLSRVRTMQLKQGKLALAQETLMRQRQRALRDLQSVTTGSRAINLAQRAQRIEQARAALNQRYTRHLRDRVALENAAATARSRVSRINDQLYARETQYRDLQERLRKSAIARAAAEKHLSTVTKARKGGIPEARAGLAGAQLAEAQTLRRIESVQRARSRLVERGALSAAGLTDIRAKSAALASTYANLGRQQGILTNRTKAHAAAQRELGMRANELKSELSTVNQRLRINAIEQNEIAKAIRIQRWDRLGTAGRTVQHLGRVMQYAGMIGGAALGFAANAAAKYETKVTLAATQTRKAGQSIASTAKNSEYLQKQIIGLMKQFPATSDEMSASAYDIYSSLDISLHGGVKLLKLFNQAAVAGQTSLDEVSQAGITVMNDFRIGVPGMSKAFQTMFAAVRFGRMTFKQFVAMMPQLSPAFSAAGYGLTEMAQAAAFMTRVMPNTRMAATSLARLTEMLARKDFIAGAKKMGVSVTNLHNRLLPLPVVIQRLAKGFPAIGRAIRAGKGDVALANLYKDITGLSSKTGRGGTQGTIQGRRALIFLITQLGLARKVYKQVAGDHDEFTKSLAAMEKTSGVTWGVFINRLKAIALEIGIAVLPAFARLGEYVTRAVDWFDNLDDGMKSNIAQWGVYGSVVLLAAGAVAFLLGPLVRLVAFMGGRGFLTVGLFAALAASIVIVDALHGKIHSLTDIMNSLVGAMTSHGWQGWVVGLAAITAGVLKLRNALITTSAVSAAGGGTGMFAGLVGLGRGARNVGATARMVGQDVRAAQGMGKMRALVSGVAASAALIPGSFLLVAAAIAAVVGGVVLWKHHMDGVEKSAARVREQIERTKIAAQTPVRAAGRLGGLVGATGDLIQARAQAQAMDRQISQARKRGAGRDELASLYVDRARALDILDAATHRANVAFVAMSQSLQGQARNMQGLGAAQVRLNSLHRERTRLMQQLQAIEKGEAPTVRGGMVANQSQLAKQLEDVNRRIKLTQATWQRYLAGIRQGSAGLQTNFNKIVAGFTRLGQLPKVSPRAIQDMFKFALQKGRMLTLPEMRAFIKAEIDPKSAPAAIRRFIAQMNRQRVQLKVKAELDKKSAASGKNFLKAIGDPSVKIKIPSVTAQAKKQHNQVAAVFRKTIPQTVKIKVSPPNFYNIGFQIASGIGNGIDAGTASVVIPAVNRLIAATQRAAAARAEVKSPSRLFARTIGIPIVQGIIRGMLSQQNQIEKAAILTIDLFNGAFLQARQDAVKDYDPLKAEKLLQQADDAMKRFRKKHHKIDLIRAKEYQRKAEKVDPIGIKDIIKDTEQGARKMEQFNQAIARLAKRGAPKQMLEDLRNLGIEGLKYILLLANSSPKELRKFEAAWKKMQIEVKRSQYTSLADMKSWSKDVRQSLKDMATEAAQKLLDTWTQFRDTNAQNFGEIFQGPADLASMAGEALESAKKDYASQVDDYNSQLTDLANQMIDAQKEMTDRVQQAIDQRKDELIQSFGQLFSGEWLAGTDVSTRLEWGQKLGFDDLLKDLQSQTDKFNRWRTDLRELAAKVPTDLAAQFEQLGPDAVDKLDILNSATSDQLAQYVALWRSGQSNIAGIAAQATADTSDITTKMQDITKQTEDVRAKLAALTKPHELTGQDVINDIQGQISNWQDYTATLEALKNRGLPLELVQQLSQMGPQALPYLQALNTMTQAQLLTDPNSFVNLWKQSHVLIDQATNEMMNNQLTMWYSHGANIASALIAGVASEQQALLDFFNKLFINLLQGKQTTMPTTQPQGYMYSGSPESMAARAGGYTTTAGTTVNMQVTAYQDETLDATLNRASFRWRTQTTP